MQRDQALQNAGYFEQRAGAHAVRVFLEAVFPVSIASILANRKTVQHLLDFAVANYSPQTYATRVLAGHHYLQAAGFDVENIKLLDGRPDGSAAYLFNDGDTMDGTDNLVADVEIQVRTTNI